jgi:tetratricopeptide (TPR) repeat protein
MTSAQQREPSRGSTASDGEPSRDPVASDGESPVDSSPSSSDPPASSTVSTRGARTGKDLAAWLSVGLAVAVTLATVPLIWTPLRLQQYRSLMHPDWYLYVLGIQLVAMPLILLIGGRLRSRRGWCVFALANAELAALAYLSAHDLLNVAAVHVLVLGLRVTIGSLWIFVLGGIPIIAWRLANRARDAGRGLSMLGKLWFSALVFLLAAEPCAAVVGRVLDDPNRLAFPPSLPDPPPGELHVAFVGESTMAGFPYLKFGIPKVVGWQLAQMYPDRKIVLDDLSAVGLNLHTALARLDRLTVRPQLLLLYSGHNEFFYDVEELATELDTPWERLDWLFEWSPLFRVLDRRISRYVGVQDLEAEGSRTLVDRPIASRDAGEKRLARFEAQLERLADWGGRLQIPELWFVPAGSNADYAPNRSWLSRAPSKFQQAQIESLAQEGRSLQQAGRWQEAADKYRDAIQHYPDFAEFEFQLAECAQRAGDRVEASIYYAKALESDGLPVRMIAPWRHKVAELAARHEVPLLDAEDVLRPHTKVGILDRSVFLDYVHPNLRAYYHLGMAAIERLGSDKPWLQQVGPRQAPARTDFASAIAAAGFTAKDLALAYRRTAEADRWMTRLRFESSRLTRDAQQYEEWSRQLESGQISPGQSGTESLK